MSARRGNPDSDLRALERRAAQGDPAAAEALIVARFRAGPVPPHAPPEGTGAPAVWWLDPVVARAELEFVRGAPGRPAHWRVRLHAHANRAGRRHVWGVPGLEREVEVPSQPFESLRSVTLDPIVQGALAELVQRALAAPRQNPHPTGPRSGVVLHQMGEVAVAQRSRGRVTSARANAPRYHGRSPHAPQAFQGDGVAQCSHCRALTPFMPGKPTPPGTTFDAACWRCGRTRQLVIVSPGYEVPKRFNSPVRRAAARAPRRAPRRQVVATEACRACSTDKLWVHHRDGVCPKARAQSRRAPAKKKKERHRENPLLALVGNPPGKDRGLVGRVGIEDARAAKPRGLAKAEAMCRDVHGRIGPVSVYRVDDGKRELTRIAVVAFGRVPETHYRADDPSSKKKGARWVHHHPRGGQPIEAVDPVTGVSMKLGGTYKITDGWFDA